MPGTSYTYSLRCFFSLHGYLARAVLCLVPSAHITIIAKAYTKMDYKYNINKLNFINLAPRECTAPHTQLDFDDGDEVIGTKKPKSFEVGACARCTYSRPTHCCVRERWRDGWEIEDKTNDDDETLKSLFKDSWKEWKKNQPLAFAVHHPVSGAHCVHVCWLGGEREQARKSRWSVIWIFSQLITFAYIVRRTLGETSNVNSPSFGTHKWHCWCSIFDIKNDVMRLAPNSSRETDAMQFFFNCN